MNNFVSNLMLAATWCVLFGGFTPLTVASGLLGGYIVLWLLQPLMGTQSSYFLRVIYWIKLLVLFLYELFASSVHVLWDVITPSHRARPAIIDMPLDVKSEAGLLLVTNLISLTPGTLSLDISPDRKTLRIHAMFADDPDAVIAELKGGMEKWVIDAVEAS